MQGRSSAAPPSALGSSCRMLFRRLVPTAALATLVLGATALAQPNLAAHASPALVAGVPTTVDPIRGAGEPDVSAGRHANTLITAPAGSGAQTSWFWRTRDDGLSYNLLGPSNGHWVCQG